jgi:PAS domain S-box-containing protein
MSVQILIVDDHEAVRSGLRNILSTRKDWVVCGEATDGIEAIAQAKAQHPDLILMDVSMPRMDGFTATAAIRQELPSAKVIIVSQNDPTLLSQQIAKVDAHGFVPKEQLWHALIPTINQLFNVPKDGDSVEDSFRMPAIPRRWLAGDGEMAILMRALDWSKTPLGPPETWSPALRMMAQFLLANRFPQLLWWGPQFCCLYNDAYVPILGAKHPWAIGRPVSEVWHEIWDILKPLIEKPFHGGPATWMEDIPLELSRRGFTEETHFIIAYSPVPDESVPSGIGGVLATVHEITDKVVGERRVIALRDLGARSVEPKSADDACTMAAETLARYPKDVPFVLLYLLDEKRETAHLVGIAGASPEDTGCPKTIPVKPGAAAWPLFESMSTEKVLLVENLKDKFDEVPRGPWSDPPNAAAVVPIHSNLLHQLSGFMVVGLSPRLQFDESYRDFLELMSMQVATTIANARAYEEERKRAEALAEIDRAKTAFFSNVSHEFRTPLTLMLGPLEDALADPALSNEDRGRLQVAHRNSLRLLKLVNTLLDFSRIEAGRIEASYEPTELAPLTAELASVFRSAVERAGLRFIVNCQPLPEPVYVDREMWEKILFNLLSNAFKFTFTGEIEINLQQSGRNVELSVRDTGTGIPESELPHLFDRFYRVKGAQGRTFEGSGIGLAFVQELVKLHGGTVHVQSAVNQGTTFTILIPLGTNHLPAERIGAQRKLESAGVRGDAFVQDALGWLPEGEIAPDVIPPAILEAAVPEAQLVSSLQPRAKILLADDNADMREYVTKLLGSQYEVVAVADGEAALHAARECHPDLVLSDVMMPRLDGSALLRELRADESLKRVPIILLSARAGEEARIEGLHWGADDYLVKPFSARELLARVRSHLAMAAVRKENEGRLAEEAEALRQSEERFRALVNASAYVIYRMSPDWSEMRQLDGRGFISDTAKSNKQWIEEYIHPEDQIRVKDAMEEAIRTKRPFVLEHRVRRVDGSLGWTLSRAVPLLDANGEILEWFGAAGDVTLRKQAEEDYRNLAEGLEKEVRTRTAQLETRTAEVLQQSELLREFSRLLLHAQDEERRHIARELHDSAGQTLTVLGINLAQLVKKLEKSVPTLASEAESIEEMVQQLSREIRTTSYLLHPPLLDENGLCSALNWYVEGLLERSGLDIRLAIAEDFGRLPRDMELVVFRLVQECLTNIHRHSGSKTASIRVARDVNAVSVEVEDQGTGMSPEKLAEVQSRGSGLGIRGIRERLRQFEGFMKIESGSTGTRVTATIPLARVSLVEKGAEPLGATA